MWTDRRTEIRSDGQQRSPDAGAPLCLTFKVISRYILIFTLLLTVLGTAVAHWSRCCATNRKIAGSIPAGVIEMFHKILPFAL